MTKKDFLEGLRNEMEINDPLVEDTNIKDLDEWDSLNAMVLNAYVSDKFGINLTVEEIESVSTAGSLIDKIGLEKFDD